MSHRHDNKPKCDKCGGVIFFKPVEQDNKKYHQHCIDDF